MTADVRQQMQAGDAVGLGGRARQCFTGTGEVGCRQADVDGQLAVRQVTQLSFTFDHRVADGGSAGGFLRFAADCLEKPGTLLAEL